MPPNIRESRQKPLRAGVLRGIDRGIGWRGCARNFGGFRCLRAEIGFHPLRDH